MEDQDTLQLLFDVCLHTKSRAAQCLELIALLASCRRSIFLSDEARIQFLSRLSLGTLAAMGSPELLVDSDIHLQLCRLLNRMKVLHCIALDWNVLSVVLSHEFW